MSEIVHIMIVEDDVAMRQSCAKVFRVNGFDVVEVSSGDQALAHITDRGDIDVVLTDLKLPGMDGLALLAEVKRLHPTIEVILMTGYGSIQNAVAAMKHGAADYITKPFDTNELLMTVGKVIQISSLREEVSQLRSELHEKYRFDNIVGSSQVMHKVYEKIEAARKTDSTILVCGESGTGKELVARAIHYNGLRADKPFVPVNCAAVPKELVESELFGHKKGAFTGAYTDSTGLFGAANGGTIFLDDILDMPYASQAKLLRALQERRIRPVGRAEEVPIDVRVIASANRDIDEAVRNDRFRQDLFYRLSVIRITLPPLRDRLDDIRPLVRHFINKFNDAFPQKVTGIADDALEVLIRYHWPGNVRELEGAIENAFALDDYEIIRKSALPSHILECVEVESRASLAGAPASVPSLAEAEKELLLRALKATGGNKAQTARLLGVSRPRLYKMIARHGVKEYE